jgi:hypothetical protein
VARNKKKRERERMDGRGGGEGPGKGIGGYKQKRRKKTREREIKESWAERGAAQQENIYIYVSLLIYKGVQRTPSSAGSCFVKSESYSQSVEPGGDDV